MARGQSAIEYLIIVGFALTVIAVLVIVYYEYDSTSKAQVITSQVDRVVKKMVDAAEEIYFLGAPTRSTLKVYMPQNVEQITISTREVNFRVRDKQGISDIEYASSVNLTGNISSTQGVKYIKIIAQAGRVCIVESGQPECP